MPYPESFWLIAVSAEEEVREETEVWREETGEVVSEVLVSMTASCVS